MKKEIQLGLFVFVGLIAFAVSILLIKDIHVQSGYRVHVVFSNVAGLLEKAWVRVNGVKIGRVETISLQGRQARVTAWIENKVKLHVDSEAKIMASGLLGVKYLEFTLGTETKPELKNGDIVMGDDPVGLDTVFNKLTEGGFADSLLETAGNVKKITEKLNSSISQAQISGMVEKMNKAAAHIEQISADLSDITSGEKGNIREIIVNLKDTTEKLDKILAELDKGDSTVGKLLKDKEMGDDLKQTVASIKDASNEAKKTLSRFAGFKSYWNYELRMDNDLSRYKSDVGIEIRPKPDKFYYLGVRNLTTETEASPPEKENTFDLNMGRDFGIFTVYAGVIRSAGGVGLKVRPFGGLTPWNRFELQAQAYDFSRKTPVNKAQVDATAKVKIGKYLKIGVGYEDIYNTNHLNSYFNLTIDDEDIAYLLGFVSLSP